ncbi:MAG: YbaN family protein [Coriobacteriia bacterium]|nr:YbaN family protein [Coriobacteriia bacterium]
MKRLIFGICGLACAALGIVGVFVPVLPTTPLLLLAAFCLSRSSARLTAWLEGTGVYKEYVLPFKQSGGIPRRRKARILTLSYGVMLVSAALVQKPLVWAILAAVALFLLWLMAARIPTVEDARDVA